MDGRLSKVSMVDLVAAGETRSDYVRRVGSALRSEYPKTDIRVTASSSSGLSQFHAHGGRTFTMMDFPGARQEPARATKQKIYRMPGTRLEKLARFVYPQRTYNKVFAQALGDLQQEYLEACAAECIWLARWVALRGMHGILGHSSSSRDWRCCGLRQESLDDRGLNSTSKNNSTPTNPVTGPGR